MNLQTLIHLIYQCPGLSDARIARMALCCAPTVRRYRRLAALKRYSWQSLCHDTTAALRLRFNKPHYCPPKKTAFDECRVCALLIGANASVRDAWEDYRATTPMPHMGYDAFRRRIKSVVSRRYVTVSRGPSTNVAPVPTAVRAVSLEPCDDSSEPADHASPSVFPPVVALHLTTPGGPPTLH